MVNIKECSTTGNFMKHLAETLVLKRKKKVDKKIGQKSEYKRNRRNVNVWMHPWSPEVGALETNLICLKAIFKVWTAWAKSK